MARIRTVKPEFWQHPIMGRLDPRVQLLALALLNHADDHGYFHADPAIVRGTCCPFREDLARISEDLARLSEVGWIEVASHQNQGDIGLIVNWTKHQKVDHPSASKISPYFIREKLAKPREILALDQGTGNREQGTGRGVASPASAEEKYNPAQTPNDQRPDEDPFDSSAIESKEKEKGSAEKEKMTDRQLILPLSPWVRWTVNSDPERTAELVFEVASLVREHGGARVEQAARAIMGETGEKTWPEALARALQPPEIESLPPPDPMEGQIAQAKAVIARLGAESVAKRLGFNPGRWTAASIGNLLTGNPELIQAILEAGAA